MTLPVLLALAGCGKGDYPEMARVTGTVTYKGKPVPNMMVNFMPKSGRPSWGKTDAAGKFEMIYDADYKGAKIGHHKVYFTPPANRHDRRSQEQSVAQGNRRSGGPDTGRAGRTSAQVRPGEDDQARGLRQEGSEVLELKLE